MNAQNHAVFSTIKARRAVTIKGQGYSICRCHKVKGKPCYGIGIDTKLSDVLSRPEARTLYFQSAYFDISLGSLTFPLLPSCFFFYGISVIVLYTYLAAVMI